MYKLIVMVVFISSLCLAAPVKEWKNFENGKVYSRKMTNDLAEVDNREVQSIPPRVEERFLHSHHKDKNRKMNAEQSIDPKPSKIKNSERHGKKTVEEEMHMRPLNERHHKFPNPALLDKDTSGFENSKISRHAFLQQVRRKQNKKRPRGGKRSKRNKTNLKDTNNTNGSSESTKVAKENDVDISEKKRVEKSVSSKNDFVQYSQTRKEVFPIKQTSYW